MRGGTVQNSPTLSRRVYVLLLAAYPSEFREKFGREMALVFCDRCREEGDRPRALLRLWLEAIADFARTAPAEHFKAFPGGAIMKVLRTVVLALLAYAFALLVVAPVYMRNREQLPGFVNSLVDALISTGVLFNLIYLVLTLPRFVGRVRGVRLAALLTALVVAGLISAVTIKEGLWPGPSPYVYVAQVVSFFFWFAAHLWWVTRRPEEAGPTAPA